MSVKKSYGVDDRSRSSCGGGPESLTDGEILIREDSFHYDASIDQLLEEDLDPLPSN